MPSRCMKPMCARYQRPIFSHKVACCQRPARMLGSRFSSLLLMGGVAIAMANPLSRTIEVVNESGKKLVVDWVHPKTGEVMTLSQGLENGAKTTLHTYVNHTFLVHEPSNETCAAENDGRGCQVRYITVNENTEQVTVLNEDLEVDYRVTHAGEQSEATDIAKHCRTQAKNYVEQGYRLRTVMYALAACMEEGAAELIHAKNEESAFESQIRLSISAELENHTCAEEGRETSAAKEIRQWLHRGTIRKVRILHDRQASQIHVLENFISEEECQAIQDAAKPKLHRGTVADGKGGHRLSDHRKAWQAGIRVPWEKEADGDLIARVVRRLYDYTNRAVKYNLTVEGQEDLMSIQYFGIGKDSDLPPDQYRPHCDGECDGLPHKTGGRVATMIIYCDVPEIGGATNFQNSGVFVKPELGAAAFFSYMDPVAKRQENGFTSHSGCPVIKGTKRIVVQWMRIGVDNQNPWDSFNTLTIKKSQSNGDDC